MAKPADGASGGSCRLGLVSLGVAVLAAAGLVLCVLCLDTRRQQQISELQSQLDALIQLVEDLQKHLNNVNSTLHAESAVTSEPAEEVVYEDDYEYDKAEDYDSYEYDDDKETKPKATVKRTTILSENSTEEPSPRLKRDTAGQVPVREDSTSDSLRVDNRPGNQVKVSQKRTQHHPQHSRSSGYQEQRRPAESEVRLRHQSRNQNARVHDVDFISQNSEEEFAPPESPQAHPVLLSAHFVGDSTSYNTNDHPYYFGNNILYHPHGLFQDWTPSDWMFKLGTAAYFPLHRGKLSIQKPGIYFVYAQVYYAATHDRCGFHVKHNGVEVAQCMSMVTGVTIKRNTCFTAVILHLQQSDQLWISEVEGHRNTSFKSSHSFFGLIQLTPT